MSIIRGVLNYCKVGLKQSVTVRSGLAIVNSPDLTIIDSICFRCKEAQLLVRSLSRPIARVHFD